MRPTNHQLLSLGLACALVLPAAITGCDSSARIYQQRVTFQYGEIVSAYPGKRQADGSWKRVCDAGPVDGILTNVTLVSSQRKPAAGTTTVTDRDQGIRPRDVVEARVVEGGNPGDINITALSNVGYELDCINPSPATDPNSSACQGASQPSTQLDSVRYIANNADRAAGHNILLLIDQSGSTAGLVNDVTFNEDSPAKITFPQNFGDYASDRNDERLAVARKLIDVLNPNDRFGAIAFGEGDGTSATLTVPCDGAQGTVQDDLGRCFGVNRSIWTTASAIPKLGSAEGGRANLWQAVDTAYGYLKGLNDSKRANHIIVLTDGPDTCARGEGLGSCQTNCSTIDYEAVRSRLEADLDLPNAIPVHIHFIQFESKGYPGRDARQVETSCLSGGHYQYLNSNSFPRDQQNQLANAMTVAMNNVRYSLMGHWQVAAQVSGYADSGTGGTLPGSLYALSGTFTVKASSKLKSLDVPFRFDVGRGGAESSSIPPSWDHRPTLRKPCTAATDCGAAGEGAACTIICSEETLTCPSGKDGITAPNYFSCDVSGGGAGSCCDGACDGIGSGCASCNP